MSLDRKQKSEKVLQRSGKKGGNHKSQTFRVCPQCEDEFGPLENLSRKYCSTKCKHNAMRTGRKTFRKTIPEARRAQRRLAYMIEIGKIVRPCTCEECKITNRKIEGAHKSYDRPLDVRWLCRSCHVKWDKNDPKNATYIINNNLRMGK